MSSTITQAIVGQEPEIEEFPLGSYDRKPQRTITYEWLVRDEDDGSKVILTLHTHHHKGRGYTASISNRRVHADGVWSWEPMKDERVLVTPDAGRYSKATMLAFAANALTTFRHRVEMGDFGEFVRGERAPIR